MDKYEALDVALGQIERQFGKGSVMKMNDQAAVAIGSISTGSWRSTLPWASVVCRVGASSRCSGRSRPARRRSCTT